MVINCKDDKSCDNSQIDERLADDCLRMRPHWFSTLVPKPDKTIPYLAGKTESAMTTYYFKNPEDALKRARIAGKQPGFWYGGITLPSGKKGWAIYRGSKIIEQYAVMK